MKKKNLVLTVKSLEMTLRNRLVKDLNGKEMILLEAEEGHGIIGKPENLFTQI